jgi:Tol biopolymer transport system component
LVDNDHNGVADVFVRDRRAGTTTRVTSTNGVEGDGDSFSPALSTDGRFVALDSKATTLDPSGGSAAGQDIFVHANY